MKNLSLMIAILALAVLANAQGRISTSPADQANQVKESEKANPAAEAARKAAAVTPATPANPKGKHVPAPKTKQEYDAFQAAMGKPDAVATEAAAREFEIQFAKSELLPMLYQAAQTKYQKADNADKTVEMGRKVLQYDPENTFALVMNATVLADRTRETDIDRDDKLKEADADAQKALENVRTGNYVLTSAMMRQDNAAAEQNLRKALDLPSGKGDSITWYRLALALDHQNKYVDANNAITTTLALSPPTSVANLAKAEQDRLQKLIAAGGAPAPAKDASKPEPVVIPAR
jgi:tetratricopeptide (TPR) repeat protein